MLHRHMTFVSYLHVIQHGYCIVVGTLFVNEFYVSCLHSHNVTLERSGCQHRRRIWLSGQFGSPLSKLHLSERNSMWGQGLTVDCSMDFVNLSSFFEARNATFLSVAEEIHPSVALGKFIPVETYIWKFIHLVRHLTGWLPYRTDFDRCQGSSSVNFPSGDFRVLQ
jgi:hypothetical protein